MALFDTLHASQRLRDEAGQSQDAAETIADVIGEAVAPMPRSGDYVTPAQLQQALHATEVRIGGLVIAVAGICLAIAKLA